MRNFICIFITLLVLSGCSSEPSVELVNATVEITDDRMGEIVITSGEEKGEVIAPMSLSYTFVFENIGKKLLGGIKEPDSKSYDYDDELKIYIEPHENLLVTTKEVMGLDIYNEEERKESGLGMGKTSIPILEPNQEGEYTLDFTLGAKQENVEMMVAPPRDQLDKLARNAMDATLVIHIKDVEIARFDLNDYAD